MDSLNKDNKKSVKINPEPLVHSKVILPSKSFISEMKIEDKKLQKKIINRNQNNNTNLQETSMESPKVLTVHVKTNKIYPTATSNQQIEKINLAEKENKSNQNFEDIYEANQVELTFSNGFSIGSTIFWYQALAALLLGVIYSAISHFVLKDFSSHAITLIVTINYSIDILVIFYIPYSVIKSSELKLSNWLALIGGSLQLILNGLAYTIFWIFGLKLIYDHYYQTYLNKIGHTGVDLLIIGLLILFFIVIYYLTKFSYGYTFHLFKVINNKIILKIITIFCIVLLFCFMTYFSFIQHNT